MRKEKEPPKTKWISQPSDGGLSIPFGQIGAKIDRYAYTNNLAKTAPATKIIFALSVLIIGVMAQSPIIPLFIFLTNTILILNYAKIPVKVYGKMLLYPLATALLSCVLIAFFFGYGEPLFDIVSPWFSLTVFKSGVTMAIATFFRVLGGLSCLYFLVLTTTMTDILITLRRIRVPLILIEMSLLIYRYIFLLLEIATQMNTAQELRLGHSGWKNKIRSTALLAGNLFIRTLEQGERTFTAMSARGYDGEIRTLDDLPTPKAWSIIGIVFFDILLVMATIFTINSWSF
ncbi:MAG: cobalt ECF transporter T component CbiQ [Candidatus Bathyarchaeum sp.]|nr:MAG: cobalt ECF transporter T component CbiQ [Candidatus Bathyarchaeum sp.]